MSLARYTIIIHSPEVVDEGEGEDAWLLTDKRVLADLPAVIEQAIEGIAEILPVGYSVEIENGEA